MNKQPMVQFEEHDGITVGHIRAASVLDGANVLEFGAHVLDYVKGKHGINLLLDFRRVDYLSSAVLTELLKIHDACKQHGGDVRLCSLSKKVRGVFQITNLDKVFTIYGPVDQAVKMFQRSLQIEAEEEAWPELE